MRAGAAQIQPADWRTILRAANHRSKREELIERHLAMMNVAAAESVRRLEIERRDHSLSDHKALYVGRLFRQRIHERVAKFLTPRIPSGYARLRRACFSRLEACGPKSVRRELRV